MSMNGWRRAELEKKRQEELRLEQVRTEARQQLQQCQDTLNRMEDPNVQQFAAPELLGFQKDLQTISALIASDPDAALEKAKSTPKKLSQILARAQAKAQQWSQAQAEAKARLAEVKARFEAARQTANAAGQKALIEVEQKLSEALSQYQAGNHTEVLATLQDTETLMEEASKATFDETLRREVVRGLLTTLKDMGFVVEQPRLVEKTNDAGVVNLVGKMPSGRTARFSVHVDGKMAFDLDGYENRTCSADLEKIRQTLAKEFAIHLGPAQITWKNPDKIAKGARNLPTGQTTGFSK